MQTPLNVGVDVAGKKVVVACAAHSFVPRTVANERGALRAWLKELPGGVASASRRRVCTINYWRSWRTRWG